MSFDRSRRGSDPRQAAEAAFRAVTRKVPEGSGPEGKAADGKATDGKPKPAAKAAVPGVRETVSLRLDRDVLDHFQEDGPGWQERINAALRKAAGL
ncbi:BrnA antitoxin family protein [Methylobacterium sp. SyP6R]|uniref:BrnA antitoxin family protein n=1 Tax=Methylobacterium sp. SyP6R TaxID=2718876 RepID=UPI001F288DEA|nr:BrnA antitoxin family protein [Methylobacterium sp. SyP6R]MCF4125461.1 BrnA antitoxin family protein [Methylobacterium sp. SyP6R]